MLLQSLVNFAALGALAIYICGYLIPGTGMAFYLLGNIAKHEARRAEEFRLLDRELELMRRMPAVTPADIPALREVAAFAPGPRLLDGFVMSHVPVR